MGRAPRIQVAGGIYHVTTHGIRKHPIFVDDEDHRFFLRRLGRVVRKCQWRCHGYVLLPTHYHLAIETPEANLSAGMHMLNGLHARRFNEVHGHVGHLLDRRFSATLVESDAHFLELARYIPLNPARAGLCRHPADWPWSSYRATAGLGPRLPFLTVDRVLSYFGPDRKRARRAFEEFVLARLFDEFRLAA